MNQESWTKLLSTAGGLTGLVIAGLLVFFGWVRDFAGWLEPHLESFASPAIADLLAPAIAFALPALLFIGSLVLTFRVLRKRSILKLPKAFSLDRTRQDQLYGRENDIERLVRFLEDGDLVHLTGESGVGKTALLQAGLLPELRKRSTLFPIYFSNYGTDWSLHPARNLFERIRSALSPQERISLGIPEVVNPITTKLEDAVGLLDDIPKRLGRVPVILFDQFDDYQLRFREQFITPRGSWASADDIRKENPFWREIGERVASGKVKTIFASRADTASGLVSAQFRSPPTGYPLARLSSDNLGPLLSDIAPEGAQPPIVADPEHGWNQLKGLLFDELQKDGRILPQEVRTVLLGLRHLKYLTPAAYSRSGRVKGVQALFIEQSVAGVAAAQGLPAATVLGILQCLVVQGASESGEAKTEGLTVTQIREKLKEPYLTEGQVEQVLMALDAEEMVRRRPEPGSDSELWQLDHDYLAMAVLEVGVRRRKWASRLEQGAAAWRRAAGNYSTTWRALLSPLEQAAVLLERMRGRLRYGRYRPYALFSLLRLAPGAATLALVGFSYARLDTYLATSAAAIPIVDGIGLGEQNASDTEAEVLLDLARSSSEVQNEVFSRLLASEENREKAARRPMPVTVAVTGLDPARRSLRTEQLLGAASRNSTDLDTLGHLTEMIHAADPNAAQAGRFLDLVLQALSEQRSESAAKPLCDSAIGLVAKLDQTKLGPVAARVGSLLDTPAAAAQEEGGELIESCLLAAMRDLARQLKEGEAVAAAQILWRRMASMPASDRLREYSTIMNELAKRLPPEQLQTFAQEGLRQLESASDRADAAAAVRRLYPFAPKLGDQAALTAWNSVKKWLSEPRGDEDETAGDFAILIGALAKDLGSATSEVWETGLGQLATPSIQQWSDALTRVSAALDARDLSAAAEAWQNAVLKSDAIQPSQLQSLNLLALALVARLDRESRETLFRAAVEAVISQDDAGDTSRQTRGTFALAYLIDHVDLNTVGALLPSVAKYAIRSLGNELNDYEYKLLNHLFKADLISSDVLWVALTSHMLESRMSSFFLRQEFYFLFVNASQSVNPNQINEFLTKYLDMLAFSQRPYNRRVLTLINKMIDQLVSSHARGQISLVLQLRQSPYRFRLLAGSGIPYPEYLPALAQQLDRDDANAVWEEAKGGLRSPSGSDDSGVWGHVIAGLAHRLDLPQVAETVTILTQAADSARKRRRYTELVGISHGLASLARRSAAPDAESLASELMAKLLAADVVEDFHASLFGLGFFVAAAPGAIDQTMMASVLAHPWTHLDQQRWNELLPGAGTPSPDQRFWMLLSSWAEQNGVDLAAARP